MSDIAFQRCGCILFWYPSILSSALLWLDSEAAFSARIWNDSSHWMDGAIPDEQVRDWVVARFDHHQLPRFVSFFGLSVHADMSRCTAGLAHALVMHAVPLFFFYRLYSAQLSFLIFVGRHCCSWLNSWGSMQRRTWNSTSNHSRMELTFFIIETRPHFNTGNVRVAISKRLRIALHFVPGWMRAIARKKRTKGHVFEDCQDIAILSWFPSGQ
jgi:hypothetical protein